MFTLDGIGNIRKVKWRNLRAGSIVLSGVRINGHVIPELVNFPVLTDPLLRELQGRYRLLADREFVVADAVYNYSPDEVAGRLREGEVRREHFNCLRQEYEQQRTMILVNHGLDPVPDLPIIGSDYVEQEYLIRDSWNSFSYMYGLNENLDAVPSFFHRMDLSMSLGDLLSNRINEKFNIPEDKEVLLHLVVDFSRSMDSGGKLDLVISALNNFHRHVKGVLAGTKIRLYVFSDTCRPVDYPLQEAEIPRGETSYSSFMKKVLHHNDRDVHNKVILFTDGLPTDRSEALKMAELIKKNRMDYTQIIFNIHDEQRHEVEFPDGRPSSVVDNVVDDVQGSMVRVELSDEALDRKMKGIYRDFSEIAEVCGGNQVILRINELVRIVSVECYDRYMGLLTLATREQTNTIRNQSFEEAERNVKKWEFPRF